MNAVDNLLTLPYRLLCISISLLVLQRYKSSSKTMQSVDDTPVKDHILGGYRHGRQNNYANQTGTDAIPAPV
jgi:hypothetical protein